ncbi:hypothetical protein CT0861_12374 [Colletotrichum tofieldiae]|uniref:Uncharacterized protein n=1 Tax=Colletotrichum tofieldiae TaxID=708197 RepID=A0A161YL74_9PEZI|nr:hypothetical protein CT0861_12374 [Colletotrichum tofieldiae]
MLSDSVPAIIPRGNAAGAQDRQPSDVMKTPTDDELDGVSAMAARESLIQRRRKDDAAYWLCQASSGGANRSSDRMWAVAGMSVSTKANA